MKNGWRIAQLKELCVVFNDGDWIETKDQSPNGIRLVQTGNVGNGFFKNRGEKARHISEETFSRLKCTEVYPGDCLISRLPDPVGRACIIPETNQRMITGVDCTIVRFREKEVLPRYFNFVAQSDEYLTAVDKECRGTTRKRISRKSLGAILIPVPPIEHQKRIVSILEEAFEAIDKAKQNAERNLQNARELFKSHLQSVFSRRGDGWVQKRLDEACEIIMGTSPPGHTYNAIGEGVPLINGPVEFSPGPFGKTVRTKFTTEPNKLCKEGDLILCVRGSTTGKMNIAGFEACIGRGVAAIRAKDYQPFINHFINANRETIYRLGSGATFPNLTAPILSKLKLSIPGLEVQKDVASKFDALMEGTQSLESTYGHKLAALGELKKSLLNRAFSGELISNNVALEVGK
jgi:type I restriction enzyme S subunit